MASDHGQPALETTAFVSITIQGKQGGKLGMVNKRVKFGRRGDNEPIKRWEVVFGSSKLMLKPRLPKGAGEGFQLVVYN